MHANRVAAAGRRGDMCVHAGFRSHAVRSCSAGRRLHLSLVIWAHPPRREIHVRLHTGRAPCPSSAPAQAPANLAVVLEYVCFIIIYTQTCVRVCSSTASSTRTRNIFPTEHPASPTRKCALPVASTYTHARHLSLSLGRLRHQIMLAGVRVGV